MLDRRRFLQQTAVGAGAFAAVTLPGCRLPDPPAEPPAPGPQPPAPGVADRPAGPRLAYAGTNVVFVRFGGGVRRRETVRKDVTTYCPFTRELAAKHGTLFDRVEIDSKAVTSHGQNTLYMLTGAYDEYTDIYHEPLKDRFEAARPTLFEYLRAHYDIPSHQTLIINGEDRIDEEFFSFSNHHNFGVEFRSEVLSLFRFKTYLLRQQLMHEAPVPFDAWQFVEKQKARPGHPARGHFRADHPAASRKWAELREKLYEMESKDYRQVHGDITPELQRYWAKWRGDYGDTGLTCPRGDRVLTELALRALNELRPRLMMINYQDPDYVHWGPASFYTRAISAIDDGIRQLWTACQSDEFYRDNTVFVIVPDCGRDDNRLTNVPYQHHFGSRCSHEIFAILAGPGIAKGVRVDKRHEQIDVTATVGRLMGFQTTEANKDLFGEAFA